MPHLISENQSAFVGGRQILDGVLMANEIVSWATATNKQLMLLKIDFAKAYDCINWVFLDLILAQMKFGLCWRNWIKGCLSSTNVSVLINVSLTREFHMERGIPQGDPLSSFLCLIIAEALCVMMQEATSQGLFRGCKVWRLSCKSHTYNLRTILCFWEFGQQRMHVT